MNQQPYVVYVEAEIEADNDQDANACAKRLAERILEHPMVHGVQAQAETLTLHQPPNKQP